MLTKFNSIGKATVAVALLAVAAAATAAQKEEAPKSGATFGILQFEAGTQTQGEGWWSQRFEIMNSIADMMTTAMVDKGYRLIERQRLGEILKEQDMGTQGRIDPATAAQMGKVIGCDYIVLGSVTQFGISKVGGGATGVLGRVTGVHANQTKAEAVIDIRIVNSTTGEIMCVGKGKGTETSTSFALSVDWWKSVHFDQEEWASSMIGKATRKAVDECIKKVDPKTSKLPSLGRTPAVAKSRYAVAAVLSSTLAIVSIDAKASPLKVGDILTLKRVTNVVKKDDKVIFEDLKVIGKVEVIEVQDSGAKVRLMDAGSETIKEGDVAEK
jgi:curli biogenesis system outer membrane secretion channel CsgG